MAETNPHVDHDPELNPEVQFEPTDIDLTSLVVFGVVMFVLLVVVFTLVWFMLKYWQAYDLQAATARYGEPSPLVGKMPESPQLGGLRPLKELQAWRDPGDAILKSAAWVDPKSRIVRIPIDQAIDEFVREQSKAKP